jgi:hypothetical protein
MALIELPQESRHPSHWIIDLYSTSLNLRFLSDQKCAVDNPPLLDCPAGRGFAQKTTEQGRFGQCWVQGCAAGSSPVEGLFAGVKNRISVTNQGGPHEGTEAW